MRFLCSTFGSSGDVFPVFGLALALRDRGHEVTFATNPHYEKLARKHEIPFEPLGTEEEFKACIEHPDLWHPQRSFKHLYTFLKNPIRRQYEIYCKHAERSEAVGITNCFGFGAFLARDKTRMPVLTSHCQPAVFWSDIQPPRLPGMFGPRWMRKLLYRVGVRFLIDPVVCSDLNPWRAEIGLPPVRNIPAWWHSSDGVLAQFPKWYCAPQQDWPGKVMQTDFPMWNDPIGRELPAEVADWLKQNDAPVVFTPGTTNLHGDKFFRAAIEACKMLGRPGILLTEFPDQLPTPLPKGIAHFRYVPLEMLLPHCSAFVHHGGVGSSSQGMAAGIPQLVMTLAHDQYDNAHRLQRLNIGDSLIPSQFTSNRVASKLARLLSSSDVKKSCEEVAKKFGCRDGLQRSAEAIESWWHQWQSSK